jgi:SNF2 family DNA or RNA helicase
MIRSLRPYQIEDLNKLTPLNCAGIFNEQRTGKTPTAIRYMEIKKADKVLVVCPASMLYPWKQAWKEWADKDAIVCEGTPKRRLKLIEQWQHGPLIISYGCLKDTIRTGGMLPYILEKKPDGCIADEAHKFKDIHTATATAMYQLCKVIPYRLALTGTPATNKPIDVFGILKWLYPDDYRSYWRFADENFYISDMYTGFNKKHKEVGDWRPGRKEIIANELAQFTTQRKRKEVMEWLSDKDYVDIKLPCTKEQRKYLNELEEFFETEHIVTQAVLDRLIRVRQICAAPAILDLKGSSPKINWLLQYIQDYPNKPILVFTKFTSLILLLLKEFEKKKIETGVITGAVPPKKRQQYVTAFQNGDLNILLIQIDAGKEGLTLDRAECEIFMDQFPPAADIQQAEDRFIATTPERADKPNQIIRLQMEDTYDEECYKLVARRASSIDVVNSYIKYLKKGESVNGITNG